MGKIGCALVVGTLCLVTFLTNPGEQEHIDYAYKTLKEQGVKHFGIDATYLSVGEGLLGKKAMDDLMRKFITRKNYYLFSLTEIELSGKKETIAVGAFGRMWGVGDFDKDE